MAAFNVEDPRIRETELFGSLWRDEPETEENTGIFEYEDDNED